MPGKKYVHTKEQSAEFLRQTLPLMSKQSAALHPFSYALWYEYVSGINAALNKILAPFVANAKTLDDETAYQLYCEHVADVDEAKVQRVVASFRELMEKVSVSAKETGEQAKQYSSSLAQFGKGFLSQKNGGDENGFGIEQILQYTGLMKTSVDGLSHRLEESQAEIEALRTDLLRAREEAMTDTMTGLLNRNGLKYRLTEAFGVEITLPEKLSVLMIDIDNFKNINDTFGHLFGDKVICAVSQVIKSNIKGQDIGVRYGGEEFLVFLPETPMAGALQLAEKLRSLVASSRIRRTNSDETLENLTISIGIAACRPGEALESLIERADNAQYASKSKGKNCVTAAATAKN